MRKALIVGIDHYVTASPLYGCVNDAHSVKAVLERHADGAINFSVKLLTSSGPSNTISRSELKDAVKDLFSGDSETALFYFAGHGFIEVTGGYLITSECKSGDDGLSLNDVLVLANASAAKNKIIVLDSCHSGVAAHLSTTKHIQPSSPKASPYLPHRQLLSTPTKKMDQGSSHRCL